MNLDMWNKWKSFKTSELGSAALLTLLLFGIVPILPKYPIDPWGFLVPRQLAMVVFALALIQVLSYMAMRWLGPRHGLMLSGFLGGLISSSSVFATLPARVKRQPNLLFPALAAVILATVATLLEAIAVVLMIAPELWRQFVLPCSVMAASGLIIALVIEIRGPGGQAFSAATKALDLRSTFRLAVIIITMLFLISLINRWLGPNGGKILAFFAGLFELQGVVFGTSSLFVQQKLSPDAAATALVLAAFASFVSKFILLWTLAGGRFSSWASASLLIMMAFGGLTYLLV